jgi:M-phase inducer tyrosine phosphatase
MNNHVYPKVHYPEVYILEGGYCRYFKECADRCEPRAYVTMDDPAYATERKEDLDQFRKARFGRTKSYAYGDASGKMMFGGSGTSGAAAASSSSQAQASKRNTVPVGGGAAPIFAAANAAKSRRIGHTNSLSTLPEDAHATQQSDDEGGETDIGDSPCPPPNKAGTTLAQLKGKKVLPRTLARSETYGPSRMAY